ncbi:MAG: YajQ family cyclic di-GMP-binding protein [Candidatus Omnitrophica bacterium]|nr:YajQ family cyclic di-GMP-binding protein [Candidatus Omnitrophota bacterium]
MAQDHSFDIVCKVDFQEVRNAVQMSLKEATQRYDFKGTAVEIVFDEEKKEIRLLAQDDVKLRSLFDIVFQKLLKRGVAAKALQLGAVENKSNGDAAQVITLQQGIPQDKGKEIVKAIKDLKLKVQAGIHDDKVKVTAPKIDDLQSVMASLRTKNFDVAMQFENYR